MTTKKEIILLKKISYELENGINDDGFLDKRGGFISLLEYSSSFFSESQAGKIEEIKLSIKKSYTLLGSIRSKGWTNENKSNALSLANNFTNLAND